MLCFKCVERGFMPQSQADVVESFKQTELAEWVNLKARREALVVGNCLRFERDGQLIIRNGLCVVKQRGHLLFAEPRQAAIQNLPHRWTTMNPKVISTLHR